MPFPPCKLVCDDPPLVFPCVQIQFLIQTQLVTTEGEGGGDLSICHALMIEFIGEASFILEKYLLRILNYSNLAQID